MGSGIPIGSLPWIIRQGTNAMINRMPLWVFLILVLSCAATAQIISKTTNVGPQVSIGLESSDATTYRLWQIGSDIQYRSPLESPGGSVSALDLKAPGKARREYDKGYQLLVRKDLQGAVNHLTVATSIYPSFVAAHTALGSAYMGLSQSDQARVEFAQAVALDDHLPGSYLNLACAELALKHFSAAEDSIRKASAMAPLDLHLLTALVYGQFMNHNYQSAVATAGQVHGRIHTGFAKVHLYAAAAWQAQGDLPQAQQELETFLREDPKSPNAGPVLQMIQQLKEAPQQPVAPTPELKISYTTVPSDAPAGPVQLPENFRKLMQESKENQQIAEAEAEEACPNCAAAASPGPETGGPPAPSPHPNFPGTATGAFTLRKSVDEVAVFFAATDHGKSVTNLTGKNIGIRDDRRPPAAITGFRNESELPLRLGIVIDTSTSVADRFKFEQDSATDFLQKVVTGQSDLAFVIGVANSVLLVQDFTSDEKLLSHCVGELAPSGGTALWDAVAFAADKLASRPEAQPVAKILVVLSDGEDNSSTATLKQAISRAQHGEVTVYAISTRVVVDDLGTNALIGEHALKTLAQLTGGAAFTPGSVHRLDDSLAELQQVIRSRYLISYKPAKFKRDGQYRAINITAEKDGHKLRVYARKGYFASVDTARGNHF
jgi:Ca-activated chloride channel homolog